MTKAYIASLIFGAIALVFWIGSIQRQDKKKILFNQIIANSFYAVQYAFLHLFSAASMNMVSVVRSIVFYFYEKKGKSIPKWMLAVFVAVLALLGYLTYTNLLGLLPIVITVAYAYSMWQKNLVVVRWIYIIAACGWIVYNIVGRAYVSMVGNVFEIISGAVALYRYRAEKEPLNNNEK